MEEKIEYRLDERTTDLQDNVENCQTRVRARNGVTASAGKSRRIGQSYSHDKHGLHDISKFLFSAIHLIEET